MKPRNFDFGGRDGIWLMQAFHKATKHGDCSDLAAENMSPS